MLQVQNKEKEASDKEKALVEKILNENAQVGKYLDISLYLNVMDAEGNLITENEKIHEPDTTFTIKVSIPEDLRVSGNEKRTFQIVRVHDGKSEILPAEYSAEEQTLTFETDRFSTYAIIYTDAKEAQTDSTTEKPEVNKKDGNQADNSQNTIQTVNTSNTAPAVQKKTSPNTGDTEPIEWMIVFLPVGIGMFILGRKRKYN